MTSTIGIDIGGTKIAGALVSGDGRVVRSGKRETPAQDPNALVQATSELINELADGDQVAGAGVACAGYIDAAGTTVLFSPNLAWRDEPFKQRLEEHVSVPVVIENDANAAAYGEYAHGAGAGDPDMVMVTVGTGVGGGIIIGGQLFRGSYGIGGEIGHIRVVPGGQLCGCGNRGCLEAYASGSALVREARALVTSGSPYAATLSEACGGDPSKLDGPMITTAAQQGDPAAVELLGDLGTWLGEGLATIASVLDPSRFVIGGGVADAGDLLLEPMRAAYGRLLTGRGHRPLATFVTADLGNDAGMIGAAALVRERL
ncbi:ROK family glucokinase [Calidifontibacter sp. DB0510]|uniref:Glucokinase n=1 Tax=Metallococcus carri TaxID=1656884 RepID=A0A967B0Q9_9MICO|nr:ROK family glucokinase [Metallococcus carri]NOP37601.1 ROK family glucokinase [Calidifontibacter sp. DB2511S]